MDTPYGHVIAGVDLPGHLGQIANAVEQRFSAAAKTFRETHSIVPPISISIVENDDLDAVAEFNSSGYRILLFSGLLKAVYDTAFALLADPDVLVCVGKRAEPRGANIPAVRSYYRALLGDGYRGVVAELRGQADQPDRFPFIQPGDPERISYALGLGNLAIEYIVEHEFAHIRAGHCDYLATLGLTSACHETLRSDFDEERARLNRSIEWHADTVAARSVGMLLIKRRAMLQNINAVFTDGTSHLGAWALATMLVFRVLGGDLDQGIGDTTARSHPHPLLRAIKLRLATEELIDRKDPELKSTWVKCYEDMVRELSNVNELIQSDLFPVEPHASEIGGVFETLETDMVQLMPRLTFITN